MGRHRKKPEQHGLRVDVKHNNVEWALKKLKRMVKDSGQILELKKRSYYKKKFSLFSIQNVPNAMGILLD